MYKQKSEIIQSIQSYHSQVAQLYNKIYEKLEDGEMKDLIHELYEHEIFRKNYLERHVKIAKAINCFLEFPCEILQDQITSCFNSVNYNSTLMMDELINLELHFDTCLIKMYNILSAENALNGQMANIFYYMLKKTKKEEAIFTQLFMKSKSNIRLDIRSLSYV
jgi:hypothetical protein